MSRALLLVALALAAAGCATRFTAAEVRELLASVQPAPAPCPPCEPCPECPGAMPAPVPTPEPSPTSAPGIEEGDLDLSRVSEWILKNWPGATAEKILRARVTARITGARTDGAKLWTTYEPYHWPANDGDPACDAVVCLFCREGDQIRGGKFDYWRSGGQPLKGLENVEGGYGGHRMPARGTECWTMIVSLDGSQRSNARRVEWR